MILPAEQMAVEFDGQFVDAGQPMLPTQGGIVLDEGFALQEDHFILPATHIHNGLLFIDEYAEYGVEACTDEVSRPAHLETDVIDFHPFTLQAWGEGATESWSSIMK
jgi:hypothetical protein